MTNQITLQIERLKIETGSYIDACLEFAEKMEIYDIEDLIEVLDPILVEKIRQEFIDKNFIPRLKNKNSLKDFFD